MKTILLIAGLLLMFSLLVTACGSVSIDIDLPGGEGSPGDGSQSMPPELLYGLYALAGLAIVIALMALFRK